jgi:hypothetical protein
LINSFALDYIDGKRDELKATYSTFEAYKNTDITDSKMMTDFYEVCEKEGITINQDDLKISEDLIKTVLKARIAANLWDFSKFYEIYNFNEDEIFIEALELIEGKYLNKLKLDF